MLGSHLNGMPTFASHDLQQHMQCIHVILAVNLLSSTLLFGQVFLTHRVDLFSHGKIDCFSHVCMNEGRRPALERQPSKHWLVLVHVLLSIVIGTESNA